MICEFCKEAGLKSKIYVVSVYRTLMGSGATGYDENGNFYAPKDPNYNIYHYRCSNGHEFKKTDEEISSENERRPKVEAD